MTNPMKLPRDNAWRIYCVTTSVVVIGLVMFWALVTRALGPPMPDVPPDVPPLPQPRQATTKPEPKAPPDWFLAEQPRPVERRRQATQISSPLSVDIPKKGRNWFNAMAFSADGARLVTRNGAKKVQVWDTGTGQLVASLSGEHGIWLSARFLPDGKRLLSWGNSRAFDLFNLEPASVDRSVKLKYGHTLGSHADIAPGGKFAAMTDELAVYLWSLEDGSLFPLGIERPRNATLRSLRLASNRYLMARQFMLDRWPKFQTWIWDLAGLEPARQLAALPCDGNEAHGRLRLSPDGELVYLDTDGFEFVREVAFVDWRTDERVAAIRQDPKELFRSMAICPHSRRVICGYSEGRIALRAWSGKMIKEATLPAPHAVRRIEISDDGRLVAFLVNGDLFIRDFASLFAAAD